MKNAIREQMALHEERKHSQAGAFFLKNQNTDADLQSDGTVLNAYKGTAQQLIVPEGIKTIGEYAFYKNAFLKNLVLPSSLETIENNAFFGCGNLENVILKNQVVWVGDFAFADCINIKTINIPSTVKHIGKYAFSWVFARASTGPIKTHSKIYVELPQNLQSIGEGSFLGSDGIVVYDTLFDPSEGFDDGMGQTNSPKIKLQIGRALYDPNATSGHWIDGIRFKPHLIFIKSSQTNQVFCAIWMASNAEHQNYLNALMNLWQNGISSGMNEYDDLFATMVSLKDKINVAFYRLQYPYALQGTHGTQYEGFLRKHVVEATDTIDEGHTVKLLQLLSERNMLTAGNIDAIFETLNNEGKTECVSWVMHYKNKHKLKSTDDLTL